MVLNLKNNKYPNINDVFIKCFEYYKILGDKSLTQLSDEHIFWQFNEESNLIADMIKHISGNMLSR